MSLINNFRKDLVGQIYQFAEYNSLIPNVDDLSDPQLFNERFERMHRALKATATALGDIASRDKKYLQEFFKGTVNPIYTKSHTYVDPTLHIYDPNYQNHINFDSNGNPISFEEPMVRYNYNDMVMDSTDAYYELVFLNGKLLPRTHYSLFNTAYGLKLYVKRFNPNNPSKLLIEPNAKVTLVLNRVFSKKYAQWSKMSNIGVINHSFDEIINTSFLDPFYNTKYVKVAYKTPGSDKYRWFDKDAFSIVPDAVNGNIRIRSNDGTYAPNFSIIKVVNSLAFWDYEGYMKPSIEGIFPELELYINSSTTKDYPIPFESAKDFYVFLNGFKLVPDRDYIVHTGNLDNSGVAKLKLKFNIKTDEVFHIRVIKNEIHHNEDGHYVYEEELASDGLVELLQSTIPVMPKLGLVFTGNRFEDALIEDKLPSVMQIKDVTRTRDFEFIINVPKASEIEYVMDNFKSNKTEFERIIELLGGLNSTFNTSGDIDANTTVLQTIRSNLAGSNTLVDTIKDGSIADNEWTINNNQTLYEYLSSKFGSENILYIPSGDIDGDGIPNEYDDDIDGDGIPNSEDSRPLIPDVIEVDTDGDGIPDSQDPDIDGDGIPNEFDDDPYSGDPSIGDPNDIDGDGIPNGEDNDIDGDGIPNEFDSNPFKPDTSISDPNDIDGDGIPNDLDDDIDGDGIPNDEDENPYDPNIGGGGGSNPDPDNLEVVDPSASIIYTNVNNKKYDLTTTNFVVGTGTTTEIDSSKSYQYPKTTSSTYILDATNLSATEVLIADARFAA